VTKVSRAFKTARSPTRLSRGDVDRLTLRMALPRFRSTEPTVGRLLQTLWEMAWLPAWRLQRYASRAEWRGEHVPV